MAAHARISKAVVHCRRCGRHVDECGRLSWVGQCLDCGRERLVENIEAMHNRSGEAYARWVSGMVRAVQRL